MENNYNEVLAKNILSLRKKNEMTQEELACICNISFQAISKWENNLTSPDISLLPILARTFKVSIDDLFSLPDDNKNSTYNDDDIRVLVYQGNTQIISKNPIFEKVKIVVEGELKNLYGYGDLNFLEKVSVKGNIEVTGNLKANTASTGSAKVGGDFVSNNLSTGSINCSNIKATTLATGSIKANNITADRFSSGSIKCDNDIKAESIKCSGDLVCNGNIEISKEVHAKNIRGKIVRNKQEVPNNETKEELENIKIDNFNLTDLKKAIKEVQKEYYATYNQIKELLLKETNDDALDILEDLQDDFDDLEEDFDDLFEDIDDLEEDIDEAEDNDDKKMIKEDIEEINDDFKKIVEEYTELKRRFIKLN